MIDPDRAPRGFTATGRPVRDRLRDAVSKPIVLVGEIKQVAANLRVFLHLRKVSKVLGLLAIVRGALNAALLHEA